MILSLIVRALTAVARVAAFLLAKLYLWIPAIYGLSFLIASFAVPFALGDYSKWITSGIVLCCVLSGLLVINRYILMPVQKSRAGRPERGAYIEPKPEPAPAAKPRHKKYLPPPEPVGGDLQTAPQYAEESPAFFRTRRDPTLYVAEYPDKLDFYRKVNGQYVFLASEPKEAGCTH